MRTAPLTCTFRLRNQLIRIVKSEYNDRQTEANQQEHLLSPSLKGRKQEKAETDIQNERTRKREREAKVRNVTEQNTVQIIIRARTKISGTDDQESERKWPKKGRRCINSEFTSLSHSVLGLPPRSSASLLPLSHRLFLLSHPRLRLLLNLAIQFIFCLSISTFMFILIFLSLLHFHLHIQLRLPFFRRHPFMF